MYYGNTGAKATNVQDDKGTYDSGTVLVYHFNEKGSPFFDSSGNNNSSKAGGPTTDSWIGEGLRLGGHVPITIPASSDSLQVFPGGAMTWQALGQVRRAAPNTVIFSRHDGSRRVCRRHG
jgi:biopolymer transport protein ExbB